METGKQLEITWAYHLESRQAVIIPSVAPYKEASRSYNVFSEKRSDLYFFA